MTAQFLEGLRYRGCDYALLGTPLDGCTDVGVRERRKMLRMYSTAERRGYRGDWEIKGGRLWLVGLAAFVQFPDASEPRWLDTTHGLTWLFPDIPAPIPADWFTGTLESPIGQVRRKGGWLPIYSELLAVRVEQGKVVGDETRIAPNRRHLDNI